MADFGDDLIDLRDILERKEAIWEEENLSDEDWEFLRLAKELDSQLFQGLELAADNEPTLILDDYFEEYAEQLAGDIGAIDPDAGWPLNRIDWEAAANDLKIDYSSIDIGEYEYWIRDC